MADKSPLEKNKPTRTNRNTTNPPKKAGDSVTTYAPDLPSLLSIPNTKVSNILDTILDKGTKLVDVGEGTFTSVKVYYMPLTEDAGANARLRSPEGKSPTYTEFDRAVQGAVASLYNAGNQLILPSTIARLITGCPDMSNVSNEFLQQICDSMDKQMYLHIDLDYTEELRRKHPDADLESAIVSGWAIPHKVYKAVYAGGHIKQGYMIQDVPILYQYADAVDQVLPIPLSYLAVGGSNNAERVALKHYMLRRILARKGTMPNTILFSTLYEVAGYPDTSKVDKKQLKRIRNFIHNCLSAWLELGLLVDFDYCQDKRKRFVSITFVRPTNKQAPALPEPEELPPEPPECDLDEPCSVISEAQLAITASGQGVDDF
jgi:hypothetical protein